MKGSKVLVLEFDRRLRLSMTRALLREGYHVKGVSSVERAVQAANRQSYELLIIGVKEPKLLNMLLAKFPPALSVLIIATEDMARKVAECSGAGIHSFLIQPFSLDKFRSVVAHTVDRACLVREGFREDKILATLEHANRLLASETDIDKFCKLVAEISAADTKADYVLLFIKDEATGKFVIKARVGDHKPAWQRICQQVMERGESILLDGTTHTRSRLRRLMTKAGISTILCIPVIARGEVIGAINNIKVTKSARFTVGDLVFTCVLGWWSSIALENVRLIGRCEEYRLHLEKLLHETSLTLENERRRVATEIHDSVVQWMVGAFYRIKTSSTLISESRFGDLDFELTEVAEILQKSITELRRIMGNLHPLPFEELNLIAVLRQAARVLKEEGITCRVEADRKLPELTLAEESAIYRIVQEALTNIRKHSQATEASLRIGCHDGTISVEISDNGQGFNPDEVMNNKIPLEHMGLLGMKERVELLGGHLCINSSLGEGTSISFAIPISSGLTMKTKV